MLRLLCITAHPDDEAGAFGGSLLLYAERGVETHILCLTPGQAATHRGTATSDAALAAIRRREFDASCKILNVTHGEVLDYPDAALDRTNFYEVVADLTARVRRIRPHVMLAIGPEGAVTAHPDHSMASLFATMAYHWAGRSNRFTDQLANGLQPHRTQKLYYGTALFNLPDRQPISLSPVTAVIDIGQARLERKISAFKAHTTQSPLFHLFENHVRLREDKEFFHLAATTVPRTMEHETDLFAGVQD